VPFDADVLMFALFGRHDIHRLRGCGQDNNPYQATAPAGRFKREAGYFPRSLKNAIGSPRS
jgi:hypothetical protein